MDEGTRTRMAEIAARIGELETELRALQRQAGGEVVADHELVGPDGPVRLSELLGERDRLIVVHNMGFACPYCTMWADGFNGLLAHIEERAAFVVASPDSVEAQRAGAARRGWRMTMVSNGDSGFARAMGYEQDGAPLPGVSTFTRSADGTLRRHATSPFGPGDKFCAVWSFFDLLPEA